MIVSGLILVGLDLIYSNITKTPPTPIDVYRTNATPLTALIIGGGVIYGLYEYATHLIRVNVFPLSLHTGEWTPKRAIMNIIRGGLLFGSTTLIYRMIA